MSDDETFPNYDKHCDIDWSNSREEMEMTYGIPTIAARAYQLWEAAGRPEGRDEEFYFRAEEELRHHLDTQESPEQDPPAN